MARQHILRALKIGGVVLAITAVSTLLLWRLGPGGPSPASAAGTVTIDVGNNWFCNSDFMGESNPCTTNITAGTTVTWNFVGSITHTTTECGTDWANSPLCAGAGWNSGDLGMGSTHEETFNSVGTFFYLCKVHPASTSGMRGKIVVSGEKPVGGIAELPGIADETPLHQPGSSGRDLTVIAAVAIVATALAVSGAAWYAWRRR